MQYVAVSTCNMEEGSFRADTNLSVRKKDAQELGTRCELKNINSFKAICTLQPHGQLDTFDTDDQKPDQHDGIAVGI